MTAPTHRSTPVLVLNCRRQGGLGIVRSLGRWGVPVWGIDPDRFSAPRFSRYLQGGFRWDFESSTPQQSLDFLCRIAGRIVSQAAHAPGGKPLLIPTTDAGALFVAEHASTLREFYLFHAQEPELVQTLTSKREMLFLARRHSVPVANSVFPTCRQDVVDFAQSSAFPVMLKGIDGKRLQRIAGDRMFLVRDAAELLNYYERFEDPSNPNLMLQEYIPGGPDTDWMFNGYFNQDSECLLGMSGRKLHQYPIQTGLTSLGECRHNQPVEEATRTFMRAIGYRGILDIDFRYDVRDATYKVLDINPRIGATFRLFVTDSGLDVARALYLDLTGQPVDPGIARDGRKWVVEDQDLISSMRYLWERQTGLKELLRSYSGVQEAAFFAADDPLPFLVTVVQAFRRVLQRSCSKPARYSRPISGKGAPKTLEPAPKGLTTL